MKGYASAPGLARPWLLAGWLRAGSCRRRTSRSRQPSEPCRSASSAAIRSPTAGSSNASRSHGARRTAHGARRSMPASPLVGGRCDQGRARPRCHPSLSARGGQVPAAALPRLAELLFLAHLLHLALPPATWRPVAAAVRATAGATPADGPGIGALALAAQSLATLGTPPSLPENSGLTSRLLHLRPRTAEQAGELLAIADSLATSDRASALRRNTLPAEVNALLCRCLRVTGSSFVPASTVRDLLCLPAGAEPADGTSHPVPTRRG